ILTCMMPFTSQTPDAVLQDLRRRLATTRWPDDPEGEPWSRGTHGPYLRELVRYWGDSFDWRAAERKSHRFAHYRAEIEGFGIHFLYEKSRQPNALPLVLTHGWPSSFLEMTKIVPLLTARGFDVVVPSLPGCGFSDRPSKLMTRTHMAG